jgi:hypothetical protein
MNQAGGEIRVMTIEEIERRYGWTICDPENRKWWTVSGDPPVVRPASWQPSLAVLPPPPV